MTDSKTPLSTKTVALINPTYEVQPDTGFKTFQSFYPFYLGEHRNKKNRRLHIIGTTFGVMIWTRAILGRLGGVLEKVEGFEVVKEAGKLIKLDPKTVNLLILVGFLQSYAWAWVGHFFLEHNKPATFKYPLLSLRGDFNMWWETITGRRPF
ncbi:hypothetical protein HDU76_013114 [Blyttiomyces sp. JEL0837]|nr:hypothetical protein HDU76_013114 [Blyttiomyces sp. JEL0837]